jgi:putative hydrolase of HD superfamily
MTLPSYSSLDFPDWSNQSASLGVPMDDVAGPVHVRYFVYSPLPGNSPRQTEVNSMDHDRLARQMQFVVEVDKLKRVFRQTWLLDQSRRENDAEHSWHLALMVVVLAEYAASEEIDLLRVLKMVLVHDLVEIDAGDTFVYDDQRSQDKADRERRAADRIFAILAPDQATELRGLWEEFEARRTPESRFAAALDRLQPLLHNYYTQGRAWQTHGITSEQVVAQNRHMIEGAPELWKYAENLITSAVEEGFLSP